MIFSFVVLAFGVGMVLGAILARAEQSPQQSRVVNKTVIDRSDIAPKWESFTPRRGTLTEGSYYRVSAHRFQSTDAKGGHTREHIDLETYWPYNKSKHYVTDFHPKEVEGLADALYAAKKALEAKA